MSRSRLHYWLMTQLIVFPARICHVFGHSWEPVEVNRYNWRSGRTHTYTDYRCNRCGLFVWYTYEADDATIFGNLLERLRLRYYNWQYNRRKKIEPIDEDEPPF